VNPNSKVIKYLFSIAKEYSFEKLLDNYFRCKYDSSEHESLRVDSSWVNSSQSRIIAEAKCRNGTFFYNHTSPVFISRPKISRKNQMPDLSTLDESTCNESYYTQVYQIIFSILNFPIKCQKLNQNVL
jgi:hypothetical protein